MSKAKSTSQTILLSAAGVVMVFAIVVLVNFIVGSIPMRADLTEDKLYTLSDGTRNILAELDTPVKIRYYVTKDKKALSQFLQNYIPRVKDLLVEYKKRSRGKIEIETLDPRPDSDAEIAAQQAGISGAQTPNGSIIYNGIEVQCLDKRHSLGFLDPRQDKVLEYELSRAITEVTSAEKPKVAIMTDLPIGGGEFNPMMMRTGQRPPPAWYFHRTLSRDYDVEILPVTTEEIPQSLDLLVVVHPQNITEKTEYAIDQYLMQGGKIIAMLDPNYFLSQFGNPNPMGGAPTSASNLGKLLGAWGIGFSSQIVADVVFQTVMQGRDGRPEADPRIISLNQDAINKDDIATNALQELMLIQAGQFSGSPTPGLEKEALLTSSEKSQLVEPSNLPGDAAALLRNFTPDDRTYDFVVRLTGKFKTAFPDGKPKDEDDEVDEDAEDDEVDEDAEDAEEDEDEKKEENGDEEGEEKKEEEDKASDDSLKESVNETAVVLVGDVDFLNDAAFLNVQNVLGRQITMMRNSNLILVQNLIEQMAGNSNLIAVRSRSASERRFTKIAEMEDEARSRYQDELDKLQQELDTTNNEIATLQSQKDGNQQFIISPEQQEEIQKFVKRRGEVQERRRQLNNRLNQDVESLQNKVKAWNILGIPLVVILAGIGLALVRKVKTAAR